MQVAGRRDAADEEWRYLQPFLFQHLLASSFRLLKERLHTVGELCLTGIGQHTLICFRHDSANAVAHISPQIKRFTCCHFSFTIAIVNTAGSKSDCRVVILRA